MPFLVLQNSTTCDATDVNNNFYFVAQGSRLPFTQTAGGTLTAVDATYDLGSSTTTWNNLHANSLQISGSVTSVNRSIWHLISEIKVTATSSSAEFTGLNGDDQIEYKLLCYTNYGLDILMSFNDTSAGLFGWQEMKAVGATITATRVGAMSYITWGNQIGKGLTEINMNLKSGHERLILLNSMEYASGLVYEIKSQAIVYNDTVNTITSIQLESEFANEIYPGTHFMLFGRS